MREYVVVASMVCGVMLASATAARVSGQAARKPAATIELRRAWTLPSSELPSGDLATIAVGVPQQNGSLLLFGPRSSGLLVVDAKGRFSRRIGREGDGPGEYRRISALGRSGDTTFVVDASLRRITQLDRNGTLLRTLRMDQVTQRFQEQYRDLSRDVRPGGVLAHGNVLLESFERPMARDGESESRIEMGVWNPASGIVRRLAPLKEGALYLSVPGPGRQPLLVRNPLAPRNMRHVQAGGERLVIAQYLGLGKGRVAAKLRIVSLAATGETLATRSIEVGLQAISQPEREQLLDEMLGAWGSARVATPEGQAIRRALAERLRAFRWHPPITSLFAADKDVV